VLYLTELIKSDTMNRYHFYRSKCLKLFVLVVNYFSFLSLLFALIFVSQKTSAQNLCTNGNFDTYTSPPNDYAQVCRATGWLSPSGICSLIAGTGSPDYYNTAGSGGAKPPNTWWATVSPHSGGGMEGFVTVYPGSSPNYREYIMRQLSAPLVVGVTYSITFWITNGISSLHQLGANNLGVAFSSSALVQSVGTPIAYTPQCEMAAVLYSTTWKFVSFTYTATAPYQYVTIGNFRNDASTTMQSFGGNYGCYYYIDDVVIQPASSLPVEWLSFTVKSSEGKNTLNWSTASETESDHFEIERGREKNDFQKIGSMIAAGNSTSIHSYSFTDETAEEISYYRIKEVDRNGNYFYSEIIAAKFSDDIKNTVLVYRETNGNFIIKGFSKSESLLNLQLFSVNGQMIFQQDFGKVKDYFAKEISPGSVQSGIYFGNIYCGNDFYCKKIIF
jgi:hypothetical protein